MPKNGLRSLVCLLAASSAGAVLAQTVPDAGSLLQQIERDRPPPPRRPVVAETPTAPREMTTAPGLTVTVKRFAFAGNTLLADDELAAALAGYLGRPLSFADLQQAAAAVARRYRESGWIVRAYLPRQEINAGIVLIQVVEGRLGGIRLDGDAPTRFPLATALRYIETRQETGAPINAHAIDRAVLLLDDLPGLTAGSAYREGGADGETDLVLKLGDTPLLLGNIDFDNTGSRSTGRERLAVAAYLDGPGGFGEQYSANLLKTEGSRYGRFGITAPVGYDGLRLGINASRLDFKVVTPENRSLDIRGIAETAGFEASYPLLRSRAANLNLAVTADRKHFDNWTVNGSTNRYRIDVATYSLSGNLFDSLGGNGASSASVTLSDGRVDLTGSANRAADAASTQTAGHYRKLKATLSRSQSLADDLALYAQYAIQRASRNLDSSEKLTLGGATGVRAYPSGEGSGSEGQTLTLELRWRLPENLALAAFQDWGRLTAINRNNTSPRGAALSTLNAYSLRGHGLALSWRSPSGIQLKGVWARREGRNPNPAANGADQDGSKLDNRFWLTASLAF